MRIRMRTAKCRKYFFITCFIIIEIGRCLIFTNHQNRNQQAPLNQGIRIKCRINDRLTNECLIVESTWHLRRLFLQKVVGAENISLQDLWPDAKTWVTLATALRLPLLSLLLFNSAKCASIPRFTAFSSSLMLLMSDRPGKCITGYVRGQCLALM